MKHSANNISAIFLAFAMTVIAPLYANAATYNAVHTKEEKIDNLSDEQREKHRAKRKVKHKNITDEQKKARWGNLSDEQKEKHRARRKERNHNMTPEKRKEKWNSLSDEQKEKRKARKENRHDNIPGNN